MRNDKREPGRLIVSELPTAIDHRKELRIARKTMETVAYMQQVPPGGVDRFWLPFAVSRAWSDDYWADDLTNGDDKWFGYGFNRRS